MEESQRHSSHKPNSNFYTVVSTLCHNIVKYLDSDDSITFINIVLKVNPKAFILNREHILTLTSISPIYNIVNFTTLRNLNITRQAKIPLHCMDILVLLSQLKSLSIDMSESKTGPINKSIGIPSLTSLRFKSVWLGNETLSELTKLTDLSLIKCKINRSITRDISRMHGLVKLNLNRSVPVSVFLERSLDMEKQPFGNTLDFVTPLFQLRELDLGNWDLRDSDLKTLTDLTTIQTLILEPCTSITNVGMGYIGQLSNLSYLSLRHNEHITTLEGISQLTQIKVLLLSHCYNIHDTHCIRDMIGLTKLSLHSNSKLKLSDLYHLTSLDNLVYLNIGEIRKDIGIIKFLNPKLEYLDISGDTNFTEEEIATISNLKYLKYLNLSTHRAISIGDDEIKTLASLPYLDSLILFGQNKCTDLTLEYLSSMSSLTKLDISNCNINVEGILRMRQLHPHIRIQTLLTDEENWSDIF